MRFLFLSIFFRLSFFDIWIVKIRKPEWILKLTDAGIM